MLLIFLYKLCIIAKQLKIWRVVRAGRRSTTGNRVNGQNRFEGSNPLLSAKKERSVSFVLFLSKPQAWYIIAARSAVHIIKVGKPTLYLITRQRAFPCGLICLQKVVSHSSDDSVLDHFKEAFIDQPKTALIFSNSFISGSP